MTDSDTGFDAYFYEAFDEEATWLKHFLPPDVSAGFTWKTVQEAGDRDPPAPVISLRTQSRLPLGWAPRLGAILSRSTGYDHIQRYLAETGIRLPCGYLPAYCQRAVAEQALMLWIALLRRLPSQIEGFTRFDRDGLTGHECQHKTLVVVGVGNIGSEVARIGLSLEMKVIGVDLVRRHGFVHYEGIEQALPQADVIVCCMNLTLENSGYFSRDVLLQAPRGVVFVNVARGEMAPSSTLLGLLEEGHLGGVALDVYPDESELAVMLRTAATSDNAEVRATLSLSRMPNAILTPHNAFNTTEAVERKAQQSIEQIAGFLRGRAFLWPVP